MLNDRPPSELGTIAGPVLGPEQSFGRIALNRTTFGARDRDVEQVISSGWTAWVDAQLNPPSGDDPALASFIAAQRLHYSYPSMSFNGKTWAAVDEDRALNYLNTGIEKLYQLARGPVGDYTFGEQVWPHIEQCAGLFIRNTHSKFQLREVMADFWLNHFSMAQSKSAYIATALVAFERDVVRPNVFGNFRTLLEEVAKSPAMLVYLDNADSAADQPNENYARELMELHTLGASAYLGKVDATPATAVLGFTDDDIIQAARAFSGWTIEKGQRGPNGTGQPNTGKFIYSSYQHNTNAGVYLGTDLRAYTADLAQGRKVLDLLAAHPATARFVCTKICRRLFGDTPPEAVIARATAAWIANADKPDQIGRVLRAILLDGTEIGEGPAVKVRRPYERVIAMMRATDSVVSASMTWHQFLRDVSDSPFAWPTPDGRPDTNAYWLNTYTHIATWGHLRDMFTQTAVKTTLVDQTPTSALASPTLLVEYWAGRLVGGMLGVGVLRALVQYANEAGFTYLRAGEKPSESLVQSIVTMIAQTPAFTVR